MATLTKYPKVSGAERFNAYTVKVEVLRTEDKVTTEPVYEFVDDPERTALMGFPCQRRIQVGTTERREPGYIVREGKSKPKWVAARYIKID